MKKIILALVLAVSAVSMANAGTTSYYGSSGQYLGSSSNSSGGGIYGWDYR
jgi:hypothetical protein